MVVAAVWSCATCGREAGAVELQAAGHVVRASFTSRLELRLHDAATIAAVRDAVAAGDSAALLALDIELVPWWCPACGQVYCGEHWQRWDVFDDDGFHDSVRGRCPAGHERMLED